MPQKPLEIRYLTQNRYVGNDEKLLWPTIRAVASKRFTHLIIFSFSTITVAFGSMSEILTNLNWAIQILVCMKMGKHGNTIAHYFLPEFESPSLGLIKEAQQ